MDKNLQSVADIIQQDPNMTDEQKESVLKSLKAADKDLQILSFKLDRTEKVKRTTAILLEETIEELEQKRKAIEESNEALQQSLKDLKAAQNQLVQQEKLASLGQLTAGIAHEIKNPLNFVNNFSELSLELVEEIREEITQQTSDVKSLPRAEPGGETDQSLHDSRRGESDPSADGGARGVSDEALEHSLILEILDDIDANLRKIHEHGSRADSIVKSMLQHSRGGSGEPEPTDLNALIREYVNLTFHGMRAGKNPINIDIDLQLDENIDEVPLVAEDFSRVILNLCNNAFDAMAEKLALDGDPDYMPKLTVHTYKKDSNIILEVQDNGPGIPEVMIDKVLQPFFTTKKGTQGTGLGLSITHDIIKAHGGELKIKSKAGQFTRFIILLPST